MEIKGLVSVIIASRNEPYLMHTIKDALTKASGDIEVIAVLDDPDTMPAFEEIFLDKRVMLVIIRGKHGKRYCMNKGVEVAKGEFLMFLDAHCMVCQDYDTILKADCDGDWVVAPRRWKLDPERWEIIEEPPKYPVDYMYICHPDKNPNKRALDGFPWLQRKIDRAEFLLDEDMIHQGSGWFATAGHYKRMGFMDVDNYGGNLQEAQEVCLSTWLKGGRVMRNKKAWFAHWRKRRDRGWEMDHAEIDRGVAYSTDFWMNNRLEGRVHDLKWLIQKFRPPTWPREYYD